MIGETIKNYEIIAELGAGGMGEVYLAKDTRLERSVALKFLPREIAKDPERRKRLETEARTASSLDHPNILTIYEIDEHEGRPFIAMAYVAGGNLKERLARGPVPIEEAMRYAVQIASGLGAAHSRGIVHRDVKPDNILLDETNRARLTDFGLAKLKESSGLTGRGTTVGTVGYMSPEQAQGMEVDARSDVFSLGVLLYELFSGKRPFVAEHAAAALYSIVHEKPEPVRDINPDIPEQVAAVIDQALAKDPADRYPDARALEVDLRNIARDLEFSRISSTSGSTYSLPTHGSKKSRVVWGIVGILIIALGALLAISPSFFSEDKGEVKAVENSLAVMYFENLSDPEDSERLGDIITELLTTDLSGSSYLKVISTQRLHDLMRRDGMGADQRIDRDVASKIASEAGASRMLMGTLSKLGGRTIITAQLVDVASGEVVGSQRVDGTDVFSVVDELSTRIKEQLGLTGSEVYAGDVPVSEATTSSTEAYREYLKGMDYYHAIDWEDAHKHFDRAIELDSTFALAYLRKGVAYFSDNQQAKGLQMLKLAAKHIDKTTGCDRLLLKAFAIDLGQHWNRDSALATLKQATTQCPTHKEPFFWVANLLSSDNEQRDTVMYYARRALDLDPDYPFALLILTNSLIREKKYEQAQPLAWRYRNARPNDVLPYNLLNSIALGRHQYDSALVYAYQAVDAAPDNRVGYADIAATFMLRGQRDSTEAWITRMQAALESPITEVLVLRLRAAVHKTYGEFEQSLQNYEQARDMATKQNLGSLAAQMERLIGNLYEDVEQEDKALPHFLAAATMDTLNTHAIPSCYALASLGRVDEANAQFDKMLEHWRTQFTDSDIRYFRLGIQVRYALSQGKPEAAIDSILVARQIKDDSTEFRREMITACLNVGRYQDAIREANGLIHDLGADWPGGDYIVSFYDLARAYDALGQTDAAKEAVQRFLSYWGTADWNLAMVKKAKELNQKLQAS